MKRRRRRRWWLVAAIAIVIVAAGVTAGLLWFGRDKTPAVRYLTATAATGTISQSVQADFTLTTARNEMTIVLGSGSSSTSSSSSMTGSTSTTGASLTTGSAASGGLATYAALTAFDPSSPSPSPSSATTSTPSPTPTPTRTGIPTPTPSGSGTPAPTQGSSRGTAGGGSSTSSGSSGSSSSTTSSSVSGVVTRITLPAGSTPRTLQALLKVSGKPLFAFVSSTPLYKTLSVDLSSGSQAANVKVLQRALKVRGYHTGGISGAFTSTTESALKAWQADHGASKTGKVSTSQFIWLPLGAMLNAWQVDVGSQISGQTTVATVAFPRTLVAQALITQADISSLKVGQKAQLTIDGYAGDAFTGSISRIDDQPATSSSTGGSSSSTQYTITIATVDLPKIAKSGMTGTLEVVIAQRDNVLLVPTSAVYGTSSVPLVRVMIDGKPTYRQVETGMSTSASTQIASGLTEGEVVVTGQYSDGTSSGSGSSGLGFPGLGGGAVRGSGGQGGFPAPPGGGQ